LGRPRRHGRARADQHQDVRRRPQAAGPGHRMKKKAAAERPKRAAARSRESAAKRRSSHFDRENQPLFLVMGGEVTDPRGSRFVDPRRIDVRGVFGSYEEAFDVWRGAAQETVDNALVKYVIVRLDRKSTRL